MPRLDIRLLGRPVVLLDGEPVAPPKGAKAWGLLAYLASTSRPRPRAEIAELLFCEADDPLGALRWNLAALRRLLGRPDALKGDALVLEADLATVDTRRLDGGDLTALDGDGTARPLLSELSFPDSPRFEVWLTGERARLLRRSTSLLREGALRALAEGDEELAVHRARHLVALEPVDEGHHALLIRAYASAGDHPAARAQLEHCRTILRAELDAEPGPAVVAAAHLPRHGDELPGTGDVPTIAARMNVAWRSFTAGSVDHGIDLGRGVVAMADRSGDARLRTTARLSFASMLSIAVRGWDEGAATATEALHLAERHGRQVEEARARSLLAGIDLMRADYPAATAHATAGAERAADAAARALNLAFLAAVEVDTGLGEAAVGHATEAVSAAEQSGDPISIGYAHAYTGHALLLGGDLDGARDHVGRAAAALSSTLVLLPWPLALLGEIEARAGDLGAAAGLAARSGALAATTDIAYQRALALRVDGLVAHATGDHAAAVDLLAAALRQARRTTGEGYSFHWPVAWILESLAQVSAGTDAEVSHRWAVALHDHAARIGMATFVDRAEALLGRG